MVSSFADPLNESAAIFSPPRGHFGLCAQSVNVTEIFLGDTLSSEKSIKEVPTGPTPTPGALCQFLCQ